MSSGDQIYDAIVIGGGFYGTSIAIYLAQQRGFKKILLVEKENALLSRASFNNQARVHNGYHYPRSFTTAYRSRVNLPKFVQDYSECISLDFTKLYAIARRNSKVNAKQFEKFCHQIGASIKRADLEYVKLFNSNLIENVYEVEEYAFDAVKLAKMLDANLKECGVEVLLDSKVLGISIGKEMLNIQVNREKEAKEVLSRYVFNCTYSGLNQFEGDFSKTSNSLKHEITEMGLIEVPESVKNLGLTVMDGSFFSIMPFPSTQLHSLSHVRYTPHLSWLDEKGIDPYASLENYRFESRIERMVRDVARYMPLMANAKYNRSLWEVKSILLQNESDDGRPILFESHKNLPGCYSILGGKIDNIYDVLEKLESESFEKVIV